MVNYTKSIIYKLCCKNPEIKQIYIGSTANEIRKRKNQHKSDCYNKNRESYNLYVYQFIRDNGGFQNWSIIIIENYPCENKRELEKRERYYIELLNATLNSYNSYRTEEEKKEQLKKCTKEWKEKNKDKNKEKTKEYQKNNKQQYKDYQKKYKDKIRDKIKKEKYTCICGSIIRLADKTTHFKTKKHLNYIRIYFNILRQNKTIIK